MKKMIFWLVLACTFAATNVQAQVPNGNFENFNYNGSLLNWGNIYIFGAVIDTSGNMQMDSLLFANNNHYFYEESTDAHSGNYALTLNNAKHAYSGNNAVTVGSASVDEDSTYTAWGSLEFIPTQIRFERLRFYYKFSPQNNDSAVARLALYDSSGYVIGETTYIISGAQNTYTLVDEPIIYTAPEQVMAYSLNFSNYYSVIEGYKEASWETKLWIDDIELTKATAIQGVSNSTTLKMFPNPAKNTFAIDTKEKVKSVSLVATNGAEISLSIDNLQKIDCGNVAKGIYVVKIETEKGILREKLVIE